MIKKTRTVGKHITFCPKCKWYEVDDEDRDIRKCPKCQTWAWTIFQYKYYDDGVLVGNEAGVTDNDEAYFFGSSLKELKRIFDKGMALWSNDTHNTDSNPPKNRQD